MTLVSYRSVKSKADSLPLEQSAAPDLCPQISPVKQGKSHIWLRLDQTFGITDKDIYLCAMYTLPVDSPYFEEDNFDILHSEIAHL